MVRTDIGQGGRSSVTEGNFREMIVGECAHKPAGKECLLSYVSSESR